MTQTTEITGEKEFLDSYSLNDHPSNGITVDMLIFTLRNGRLSLLLIERKDHPFKGSWALPGGFVQVDEDTETAALRELQEETGLTNENFYLEQVKTYSTPGRDPRGRVVSVAYLAVVPGAQAPVAGDDAADARYFAVEDLNLSGEDSEDLISLAFDHAQIITDGLERVRSKFEYSPLATRFLEESFTLADLRRVYEAVWGSELHAANFRRKVLTTPAFVVALDSVGESSTGGRSAALYGAGEASLLHPALLRKGLDHGLHDTSVDQGIIVDE